jgi:alkylhydroperoxidase family enzyme
MVGLSEEDVLDSRHGGSPDSKVEAALRFASQMVEKRGWVSDEDVAHLRSAGYEDAEIAEIVANVALIMFTNYFNHVAETVVDFPPVPGSADRSERN